MEADNVSYKTLIYSRENLVQVFTGTYTKVDKDVAIKILYFDQIEKANVVFKEILSMQRFRDLEGVAKLYDQAISQKEDGKFFIRIVMELYTKGDLNKLINARKNTKRFFTEAELIDHLKSIVKNFAHFQTLNLAHRDIKPENIFIGDDNKLIIGDLGCFNDSSQQSSTIAGTPNYLSPELKKAYVAHLSGESVILSHDVYKSDVFSLGLTFLYMACLDEGPINVPFNSYQYEQYIGKKFNKIQTRYPEFVKILILMLYFDPSQRYDFKQLASHLSIEIKSGPVQLKCSSCDKILTGQIWSYNDVKICNQCIDRFEANKTPPKLYCKVCRDLDHFCEHACEICKMIHGKNQSCFEILHQRLDQSFHYCPQCSSACLIAIRWLICKTCEENGREKYNCVVCNKKPGNYHTLCVLLMNQKLSNRITSSIIKN